MIHVSRTASRGLFASIARLLPFVRADHINLAVSGFNTIWIHNFQNVVHFTQQAKVSLLLYRAFLQDRTGAGVMW